MVARELVELEPEVVAEDMPVEPGEVAPRSQLTLEGLALEPDQLIGEAPLDLRAGDRGEARLAQGNGPGAEQDWTPFVVARPGDLEALLECADCLLREGHVLPTLNLLSNYEEQVGHDEDVRTEALRIVEQTADPKNLGQFLERSRKDFPESDLFQLQWARYLMATGDLDASHEELKMLAKRSPDWGLVQFELAELWTRKDDIPAALPHLKRAMSSDDVPSKASCACCSATASSLKKTRSSTRPSRSYWNA